MSGDLVASLSALASEREHDWELRIGYLDALVGVRGSCERVRRAVTDLDPFLAPRDGEESVTIEAVQVETPEHLRAALLEAGRDVVIDASLYLDLQSHGRRVDCPSGYAIHIDKTGSTCLFMPDRRRIQVLNGDEAALARDTVRILKSLASLHAESRGAVMVHSSGVVLRDGRTVLFPGDSRNGKTTVLLEALTRFDGDMLSCDTCMLQAVSGRLVARGWPSNFSVSIGTMYDYDVLTPMLPEDKRGLDYGEAWAIFDKHVLDARDVVRALDVAIVPEHEVAAVVCLSFAPEAPIGLRPLTDRERLRAWLQKVYLGSRDPLYPNWHGYWEVDEQAIDRSIDGIVDHLCNSPHVALYELNWAPSLDRLLRSAPLLDQHYLGAPTMERPARD